MEIFFLSSVLQPWARYHLSVPCSSLGAQRAKDDCETGFFFEYTEESTGRRQQTTVGALSRAPANSQQKGSTLPPSLLKRLAEALPLPSPRIALRMTRAGCALQVYFDTISIVTGFASAVVDVMFRRGVRIAT
jgi:hypothetical protein